MEFLILISLQEDIEIIHSLGVDAYRFSISWTRILPSASLILTSSPMSLIDLFSKNFLVRFSLNICNFQEGGLVTLTQLESCSIIKLLITSYLKVISWIS